MKSKVIASLATPWGTGAIALIRVSGDDSIQIVNRLTSVDLEKLPANMQVYSKISNQNKFLDEVMISVFHQPKSFTGENMVEISTHGGQLISQEVLKAIIDQGAILAPRGEFTRRAFLNKKVNLLQAEAINDIINAKSEGALNKFRETLNGNNTQVMNHLKEKLLNLLARIEVNLDYPEYENYQFYQTEIQPEIEAILMQVENIIDNTQKIISFRSGYRVVIIGKPNVGKSSLLNAILGKNKAIVTQIAGTTRDVVEGEINFQGYTYIFYDTAGMHESQDIIELEGIHKTKEMINFADVILLVLDGSEKLTKEDDELIKNYQDRALIITNKKDLGTKEKLNYWSLSTKNPQDIQQLLWEIYQRTTKDNPRSSSEYLTNDRQLKLMENVKQNLKEIPQPLTLDLLANKVSQSLKAIFEILGQDFNEELLDYIFNNFCIGK
ncbi:MAG: tRNA uridine-5-carboxymethylaminomethyl(34) synthesis GTPase MnmE [Acholeplasmatales bacterium]|jgi:tRNA modification GTPase|nr:tRNA uridine-5-carboxymethylaminomethyl(34) synthesis GTPase MnmE [Acholeplasmatales bacterium]